MGYPHSNEEGGESEAHAGEREKRRSDRPASGRMTEMARRLPRRESGRLSLRGYADRGHWLDFQR